MRVRHPALAWFQSETLLKQIEPIEGDQRMSIDRNEVMKRAEALTDAMRSLDHVAMGVLLAPESIVWHNTDEAEQKRDEFLTGLEGLHAACEAAKCTVELDILNRETTANGFVQTHRWLFRPPAGTAIEIPCSMWVTLNDKGEVLRLDEYLDSTASTALAALLAGDASGADQDAEVL